MTTPPPAPPKKIHYLIFFFEVIHYLINKSNIISLFLLNRYQQKHQHQHQQQQVFSVPHSPKKNSLSFLLSSPFLIFPIPSFIHAATYYTLTTQFRIQKNSPFLSFPVPLLLLRASGAFHSLRPKEPYMEAIKRQASKLREQVAKQHHAIVRQFTARYSQDPALIDEEELHCHHNLQNLYKSTKAAKSLQRNIVRGVESFISISTKQMEIVKRLADDCCKYGNGNPSSSFALAKASVDFGTCHKLIEKEKENLLKILGEQVYEPLREMIMSAPLEDARLLTYRYERIRQDVESQITEVMKRQMKSKEAGSNDDSAAKLKYAESKLTELQTTLSALGKEATTAMLAVEMQQQKVTYERLLAMVDAERVYHQSAASMLDKLHDEMVLAKEQSDALAQSRESETNSQPKSITDSPGPLNSIQNNGNGQANESFEAEVIHPFDAQADGELSISIGDIVLVRQEATNGWSEGECQGKTGWFPSAYVRRRDKVLANKVIESD